MFRMLFVFHLLIIYSIAVFSKPIYNADTAFVTAKLQQKPLLMVFSGSDWCPGCIRFQKRVMSKESFKKYADEHLVVLIVDFPQHKMVEKELKKQNEILADKYNPQSLFPRILVFTKTDDPPKEIIFVNQNVDGFIQQLNASVLKN